MKYILLGILITSSVYSQENTVSAKSEEVALGYIDCETKDEFKKISDFVDILKSGEEIDPKDLVNNPNFLSPCFKEQAGNYQSSFFALQKLTDSITDYKESEHDSIEKTNEINEKLGTKRSSPKPKSSSKSSATSAPQKVYKPTYSKAYTNFKKKAKLVGTIKNDDGYLAMLTVGALPFNNVAEGEEISGVRVVEIGFGFIKYKDLGASGRTGVISVGQ